MWRGYKGTANEGPKQVKEEWPAPFIPESLPHQAKIERSLCGKYVRVTVGTLSAVVTAGEFSRMVAQAFEFMPSQREREQAHAIFQPA